jgi:outer membrane protein OmpA-like peptidoglycan-associated protein/opacity protein-like surface antigen
MHVARRMVPAVLTAVIAVIATAVIPSHAAAPVRVQVFPWVGYANFAKNVNFDDDMVFGGSLGLAFAKYVGVQGHLGYSSTETIHGFTPYAVPLPAVPSPQDVKMLHYGGDLVVNLRPSGFVNPYLLGGWQEGRFEYDNEDSVPKPRYLNGWELGAGLTVRLTSALRLRAEFRDALWKFKAGTPPPAGQDATDNQFYTAGLEFSFPSGHHDDESMAAVTAQAPLDSDHDGIPDAQDQCPATPPGVAVDARGCPVTTDADNDGVPDAQDQCPNTPAGTVVDARGCPKDSDNDGVPDNLDECANTPAGVAVDAKGCPQITDADNDGVPDDKDLCPFTPANAKVDKDGCPITLTEREVELLDKGRITERNIHFETAKWDILPESRPVLDEIGAILIQWPRLRIEVGGHCDARGSDAYNLDLSNKRAGAVLDYLVTKYPTITRDQYSSKGYGERVPVASNKTVEGMAQNRRVEFKVLNPEELTKEKERRRLLQKGEGGGR